MISKPSPYINNLIFSMNFRKTTHCFSWKSLHCSHFFKSLLKWKEVVNGIPQGSVLDPLLVVIFINDMPDGAKFNIWKLFADDCKLYGIVNTACDRKQITHGSTQIGRMV